MTSNDNINKTLTAAHEAVSSALQNHGELCSEMDKLFSGQSDEALIIARARRLLEVLIVDHYIKIYRLTKTYKNTPGDLYKNIKKMGNDGKLSAVLIGLCHEVRMAGNKAIHYKPKFKGLPKFPVFNKLEVETVIIRCAEIFERLYDNTKRGVYSSTLKPPFDAMYQHLISCWEPKLRKIKNENFPLNEAVEIVFRSAVSMISVASIKILEDYEKNGNIPLQLPVEDEKVIRQLRNAGMIKHDGKYLFNPTRSSTITLTKRGKLLTALNRKEKYKDSIRDLVNEVIGDIASVGENSDLFKLLEKIMHDPHIKNYNKDKMRQLRNLNLVGHCEYYLESSEQVFLTTLGYYVAGKCDDEKSV